MRRRILRWGLWLALLGMLPAAAAAARPTAVELKGRDGGLGQIAITALDDGVAYVSAERLAALLKGSWKVAGASGTLTVGGRSAQFTRNEARVRVGAVPIALAAPPRVGASGWLLPEDFLDKGLPKLAPGVTSARLTGAAPVSATKPAPARPTAPGVALTDLRLRSYPSFTRIVLEAAASVAYAQEPGAAADVRIRLRGLQLPGPHARQVDDGVIKEIKLDAADGDAVLRVTLDGAGTQVKHFSLQDPFRVVVDIHRPKEPVAQAARGPVASVLQLVVLDAGHGGHDPGATGPSGVTEKEVVLDVTRRVARMVEEARIGVKVALTRSTDVFVPLRDRTNFANKQRADLFLSIHANAHPRAVSEGVETYFLSSEATDNEARQVAAIENGVVQLESPGARQKTDALKSILWDLAQSEFQQESSVLAETVQDSMTRSLQLVNRGVKQAGFYVLGGAAMPAILVEIGFLTNPKEEKKLSTAEYRESVARAILAGLTDYKRRFDQRMRTVRTEPGQRKPDAVPPRSDAMTPGADTSPAATDAGAARTDSGESRPEVVLPRVDRVTPRLDAIAPRPDAPRPSSVAPKPDASAPRPDAFVR